MIVIILNVTWSVYIFYNTLNTFFSPYRNNRTEHSIQTHRHTHTYHKNWHCWIAFHIQMRMIASGLWVCAFEHLRCIRFFGFVPCWVKMSVLLLLRVRTCGCTIVVSSFYLRKIMFVQVVSNAYCLLSIFTIYLISIIQFQQMQQYSQPFKCLSMDCTYASSSPLFAQCAFIQNANARTRVSQFLCYCFKILQ